MTSSQLIKSSLKLLHGFLPVHKPKNIDINKMFRGIRQDLHFSLRSCDTNPGSIDMGISRYLEPFASGLVTLTFGRGTRKNRNFILAEYEYLATLEFGTRRMFDTIDGEILDRQGNIDNVNKETIEKALDSFNGKFSHPRNAIYRDSDIDGLRLESKFPLVESIYKLMPSGEETDKHSSRVEQKYKLAPRMRELTAKIKLLDYAKPIAKFHISTTGGFLAREFACKLTEKLGVMGCLIELVRIKEGPMSLSDLRVAQVHNLNPESYVSTIQACNETYNNYLYQFEDSFKTKVVYRAII